MSPGKDQNSKFEEQFLLNVHRFHTLEKLKKNHKLNHHKFMQWNIINYKNKYYPNIYDEETKAQQEGMTHSRSHSW